MERPPRVPNLISKRVLQKWEDLVRAALRAEEPKGSFVGEEYGLGYESSASSAAVPESLSHQTNIDSVLRVADEIHPENPQVARILCEYAYSMSQNLDPRSEGRGVMQFKTGLKSIIEQNRAKKGGEKIDRPNDIHLLQEYYNKYREMNKIVELEEIGSSQRSAARAERKRKVYEKARILNEVVDAYRRESPEETLKKQMENDAEKIREFKPFNILPLETPGVVNAFQMFPEVTAATGALEWSTPPFPEFPYGYERPERALDVFDFLQYAFGFQEDNVANQREHLILLLANAQSRLSSVSLTSQHSKLDGAVVTHVHSKIVENYERWCLFLRKKSQIKSGTVEHKVCIMALYLLIWGEAANIRFLPECLCYIFHHMADEMYDLLEKPRVERSEKIYIEGSQHSFLEKIICPIHEILAAESDVPAHGRAAHSAWRNYDDFNEFFWAPSCFELSWPWRLEAGFFLKPKKDVDTDDDDVPEQSFTAGRQRERKLGKTHFVEHRTFLHVYHSFHRLWIFLVCMLQGLTIFAFCNQKLDTHSIKYILSVGSTFIVMRFVQCVLDVILMFGAYRSTRGRTVARMLIRFLWFALLSAVIVFIYVKVLIEDSKTPAKDTWFTLYYLILGVYGGIQLFLALLFRIPFLRSQADRCSDVSFLQFFKWVKEERYYVGRGMYEKTSDYVKYTMFWLLIGLGKFAFSYFLEIKPMVKPTRIIIGLHNIQYRWHDLISKSNHNALTLLSLWAPVVMIYFLDTQVWYTVMSALVGALEGARMGLGEIRSLDTLRQRFTTFPEAFHLLSGLFLPAQYSDFPDGTLQAVKEKENAIRFAPLWNEIIGCLREEDLISNREKLLLMMPDNKITTSRTHPQQSLVQWPLFLLANKVYVAKDILSETKYATAQDELWERMKNDLYLAYAVQEAYESLQVVLSSLLNEDGHHWVEDVFREIDLAIEKGEFGIEIDQSFRKFDLKKLGTVLDKTAKLTAVLRELEISEMHSAARRALVDLYEVVMHDFITDQNLRATCGNAAHLAAKQKGQLFSGLTWPSDKEKTLVSRLHYILSIKDSALSVPSNLEARRRLQYFTNSLFMKIPESPSVRKMLAFSVFTPYYAEDVMYSLVQLNKKNIDGITTLFYLQKIFPDDWTNFKERMLPLVKEDDLYKKTEDDIKDTRELRLWASYRGQTLARTVRGMMYYKRALILQAAEEGAFKTDFLGFHLTSPMTSQGASRRSAQAQAELKFTYVVSAQIYGSQRSSSKKEDQEKAADISFLMQKNDSLRIAYIHVVKKGKDGKQSEYYSKLVKADPSGNDQEIYSIKLPGKFLLGEGKPENQNHAIIFTRGDALQTIDMNQENYMEEAFKMRNLLEEFDSDKHGRRRPTILGVREHVFTGSVSSLAWFMSLQESSFVTIGQRVLARPLKVRMHYGHPDVFDRLFHISRGGISKPSRGINLSEDIFAGFNSTLRQGNITHHEYIQVGKGRDVGLNQIAAFEAKVASGNGEQTLSRDVYRLGQLFDLFRMLSFFFTSVGFYVTTMMTVLTIYAFLYGKVYLALSGVEASLETAGNILNNAALQTALQGQFLFQIGVFTAVPMFMNFLLEQGVFTAVISFCTMQLQLSSVFFTFSLGTRTHYFGRTILHGGAKYRSTGRGFVVEHIPFAENYRLYSRSHFVKAMEIIMLLVVYRAYGAQSRTTVSYIILTFSSWFLAISWLYAPYIFNPSGFEWQKTVKDFEDWTNWLFYKGGIGDKGLKSWEVWWNEEHAHIQTTRGRIWECILSFRFFIIQYGVVYALHVTGRDKNFNVYGFSWVVLAGVLLLFKGFTLSKKASANFQLLVRLFQGVLFLACIGGLAFALADTALTVGDMFAAGLALIPTGWGLLSIAIAVRPVVEKVGLWKSVRGIARLYDAFMGMVIFIPIALLSWFPFISTFQTRLVFNQAFSRGLEISVLLAGDQPNASF
ncbi:unnamed protein product [Sphagnum troendelagicum]